MFQAKSIQLMGKKNAKDKKQPGVNCLPADIAQIYNF